MLVAVSFILASLQITCNVCIGATRIMVAASLDRALPSWFSRVNSRLRSPVNAHVIYIVGGILVCIGYNYVHSWTALTLGVTFACGYVFTISSLAAALLPYRAKALFEAAPGAQYKFAGIPLVTIFGVLGFIFGATAEIAFLVKKGYGLSGTTPYVVVGGIFVIDADRLLGQSHLPTWEGHQRLVCFPRSATGVKQH